MLAAAGADAANIFAFTRRISVCKRTLDFLEENSTLVLCVLGGAALTIPLLGFGPLIAVMLGMALGIAVLHRLADWAT